MGFHTPVPQDLGSECLKCAKIIEKFVTPDYLKENNVIPPDVIEKCEGIAILTVIKAGFVWSGRAGSGLVLARLPNGEWSAPSAIGTAGMGFGGQIGAELTDFVIVLNTQSAVKAFSMGGNVTLGGNLSVAAGPFGRNAEAAGAIGRLAPIYSYSKTKGLFAGISIEGSVIVERKDANAFFYNRKVSAKAILTGEVQRPPVADPLYRALNQHVQNAALKKSGVVFTADTPYVEATASSTNVEAISRLSVSNRTSDSLPPYHTIDRNPKSTTYPRQEDRSGYNPFGASSSSLVGQTKHNTSTLSLPSKENLAPQRAVPKPPPVPPNKPKRAIALYDFDAQLDSDLALKEGDVITVTKMTNSTDDWWTGQLNGKIGQFPANYVRLQ